MRAPDHVMNIMSMPDDYNPNDDEPPRGGRCHYCGIDPEVEEQERAALAASQCHDGYGDDYGNWRCKYQDEIAGYALPNPRQREVGEKYLRKYGHLAADDPAFVAAVVYRLMMRARLEPDAKDLGDSCSRMSDEEAFAEGMEAAHCGLLMKDGPRGRKTYRAWCDGFRQALKDRGEYPEPKTT